jgi:hypothetical protein
MAHINPAAPAPITSTSMVCDGSRYLWQQIRLEINAGMPGTASAK